MINIFWVAKSLIKTCSSQKTNYKLSLSKLMSYTHGLSMILIKRSCDFTCCKLTWLFICFILRLYSNDFEMKNVFDHKISQKLSFSVSTLWLQFWNVLQQQVDLVLKVFTCNRKLWVCALLLLLPELCVTTLSSTNPRRTQTHTHTRANAVAHPCPHIVRTVVRLTLASLTTATTMWSELKDGQNVS